MDPELAEIFKFAGAILPMVAVIVAVAVGGWVFTTWLKIKNGYPLATSWGRPLHPSSDNEAKERIKLLTNENAQLRAEIGVGQGSARNDRADRHRPARPPRREIDSLSIDKGGERLMGPGEVFIALIVVAIPTILLF